jgi:hypothetical protein
VNPTTASRASFGRAAARRAATPCRYVINCPLGVPALIPPINAAIAGDFGRLYKIGTPA